MKKSTGTKESMNGFHIKQFYDFMDLRTVVSQSTYLRGEAKKHHLQHGECVVYTNVALSRFRMVLKIQGAVFMCVPEIDTGSKRSIYLHVSEELARLANRDTQVRLGEIQEVTAGRIQRQLARAKLLRARLAE